MQVRKPGAENSISELMRLIYFNFFKPIFLIFDQFEELFIFGSKEEKMELLESLKQIIECETEARLIFVIREEYLAHMTEIEKFFPDIFENKIRIEKMTYKKAVEVIDKPCEVCDVQIEAGLSKHILKKLLGSESQVELTYLQIIMDRLYREAIKVSPSSPKISRKAFESFGRLGNVLASFLDEQLSKIENPELAEAHLKKAGFT